MTLQKFLEFFTYADAFKKTGKRIKMDYVCLCMCVTCMPVGIPALIDLDVVCVVIGD